MSLTPIPPSRRDMGEGMIDPKEKVNQECLNITINKEKSAGINNFKDDYRLSLTPV